LQYLWLDTGPSRLVVEHQALLDRIGVPFEFESMTARLKTFPFITAYP